ncbi:MAG: hypothetical protein E7585_00460 [Ruminococcaceae bacterium]|nr:hypothetical protein [Oscillospiraceae bacterium]
MKIGQLNSSEIGLFPKMTYTRIGGAIPLPPDNEENGTLCWTWKKHHATGIELHFTFDTAVYLATLTLHIAGAPERATLFNENGVCIGSWQPQAASHLLEITAAARGSAFCLRIIPTMADLTIDTIALYGAAGEEVTLFPSPSRVDWSAGSLPRNAVYAVTCEQDADCLIAADFFAQRAHNRWGAKINAGNGLTIQKDFSLPFDGYTLKITENGAFLAASTRVALLYGIERLFELERAGAIPCCHIQDAPYKEMRGVHMYLPHRSQLPFTKSLIKNILLPYHYNQIFLEFAGGMRFDSHPEISEGWLRGNALAKAGKIPPFPHGAVADGELLEKNEVSELCDFIHALGIEVIPEVQSFGHVQYITYAHPEIAEIDPDTAKAATDERHEDLPPSLFYKHSYCPQNPKSYEIIHDLIDEIVEVAKPKRFVHMGHDEIYQLGLCPKCKELSPDKLYEADVLDLHAYLAQKGLRMMLWADMVQPVSKYRCYPCLERLPKDIIWLDFIWYFHLDKDIEENLLTNGNTIMIGNLYSSHFPRFEKRAAPSAVLGGEVSFWAKTDEESIAREGKFYDLLYTAEMLWSKSYCERLRPFYESEIAMRLPELRAALRNQPRATVRESIPLPLEPVCDGLSALPARKSVVLPLNRKANGLRFTHTTLYREKRIAWRDLTRIGSYTVEYEDGSKVEIPITYDGNVRCYRYRFGEPLQGEYYRHEGYVCAWQADPVVCGRTADGTPITLYALDWKNPHPQKKITAVLCQENAESAAGLLLCELDTLQ